MKKKRWILKGNEKFTRLKMKENCQNQNFPLIYMHTQLNMRVPKIFKKILLL